MSMHDTERVIQEFLGDNPRATEWRALRHALSERLAAVRLQQRQETEAGADSTRLRALEAQATTLRRQVAALETEEAVTRFVEDSIKVTLAKSQPEEDEEA